MPQKLFKILFICSVCLFLGCAGHSVLAPNPKARTDTLQKRPSSGEKSEEPMPVTRDEPEKEETAKETTAVEDGLDFSLAFAETERPASVGKPEEPAVSLQSSGQAASKRMFPVPTSLVRVALHQNLNRLTVYSIGTVDIHACKKQGNRSCRGRIAFKVGKPKSGQARAVAETSEHGAFTVFLPCTLLAKSAHNYFELDEQSYRGSIILPPGNGISFSVINWCNVEEYLRGVVPLEIGKRSEEDLEALKAQAVAARTYTYKRIIERRQAPFDLLATIDDQVYGGVTAEYPLSDRAVTMTKNLVAVYGDSLIYAYYHSTCGGITANIADVWLKPPQPYLQSIRDTDGNGKAYCAISRYYTWRETWNTAVLSSIIKRFGTDVFPDQPQFQGTVTGITVLGTYPCGRVSVCRINSSAGEYKYGGDKIRFVLRRNSADYPILRSARFTVESADGRTVTITGKGYGHGVGMCQMGAVGRARAGQTFEQILKAYYKDILIATVTIYESSKKLVYE
jgi:SpoIID/LytB domain protein